MSVNINGCVKSSLGRITPPELQQITITALKTLRSIQYLPMTSIFRQLGHRDPLNSFKFREKAYSHYRQCPHEPEPHSSATWLVAGLDFAGRNLFGFSVCDVCSVRGPLHL